MSKHLAVVLVLSVALACGGSSKTGTPGAVLPATRNANRDLITREEIQQTQGVTNAFDLVRRLRPHFFTVQGRTSMGAVPQSPIVRLDGSVLGDVQSLKTIELGNIMEVRYYSIVEAETKWSGDRGRPVIAVTTRRLAR